MKYITIGFLMLSLNSFCQTDTVKRNDIIENSVKTNRYVYDGDTSHLEIEFNSDSTFSFSGGCFYGVGVGTYSLRNSHTLLLAFRSCNMDEKSSHDDLCGQKMIIYSSAKTLYYRKLVLKLYDKK